MTPVLPLRIGAVIGALFAAGHTRGMPWTPVKDGPAAAVLDAMKTVPVSMAGTQHSYWDYYQGFGLSITVYLFALAVALWQIAALARQDARRLRPLLLTLALAYSAAGIIGWQYIFVVPLVFSGVIVACILAAWVLAGRERAGAGA